jgi:hypothetical protein
MRPLSYLLPAFLVWNAIPGGVFRRANDPARQGQPLGKGRRQRGLYMLRKLPAANALTGPNQLRCSGLFWICEWPNSASTDNEVLAPFDYSL